MPPSVELPSTGKGTFSVILGRNSALEESVTVLSTQPKDLKENRQVATLRGKLKKEGAFVFSKVHIQLGFLYGSISSNSLTVAVENFPKFSEWFDFLFRDKNQSFKFSKGLDRSKTSPKEADK
jgi:hypothetical protein